MSKTAERTHPELWEAVKAELKESSKGGEAGEWSARKAQLAVQEYKKRGGGYRGGRARDNSLKPWTEEKWATQAGKPSGDTGERYLPEAAREALTDEEYRATTAKKRADTGKGKQFSAQPEPIAAKTARFRHGGKSKPATSEPARSEPGKSQPAKSQPAKSEPAKPESAKPELAKSESAKPKLAKSQQAKLAAAKPEPQAEPTKADLMRQAKMLEIDGRSRMTKEDLATAIRYAKH